MLPAAGASQVFGVQRGEVSVGSQLHEALQSCVLATSYELDVPFNWKTFLFGCLCGKDHPLHRALPCVSLLRRGAIASHGTGGDIL